MALAFTASWKFNNKHIVKWTDEGNELLQKNKKNKVNKLNGHVNTYNVLHLLSC